MVSTTSILLPLGLVAYLVCVSSVAGRRYPRTGLMSRDVSPNPCYTMDDQPAECRPDFENAALGRAVEASSTCGLEPENYCKSTIGKGGNMIRNCFVCDARNPKFSFPAAYLTDVHNPSNVTCWMSKTYDSVQYLSNVTLRLKLNKKYELTYVSLEFCSARPDSMAIYKSDDYGRTWKAFQYYSNDCRAMYNKSSRGVVTKANEQEALCTQAFSKIDPLSGARVAFSTLEGRPSSANFDKSPALQDWMTATDIKLVFNKLNTLGDEGRGTDDAGQNSYYYSLSDFAVGGRCKCNGHASRCVRRKKDGKQACDCQHNTAGRDCETCMPFFQDRPWRRATKDEAHGCVEVLSEQQQNATLPSYYERKIGRRNEQLVQRISRGNHQVVLLTTKLGIGHSLIASQSLPRPLLPQTDKAADPANKVLEHSARGTRV
ncbi:netrin-1 [Elysia marginata]|uniref:Netrin-1 n=1 Tax=Elysia marginata TaxID=1093978 RepID=A0AAV4FZA0_9GAST|nr:netrin-1 [Elysia marginata]